MLIEQIERIISYNLRNKNFRSTNSTVANSSLVRIICDKTHIKGGMVAKNKKIILIKFIINNFEVIKTT